MRIARLAVASAFAVGVVLGAPSRARADEPHPEWKGFGVGSYVQYKATEKTSVPGKPDEQNVSETKFTLLRVTDDAYVLNFETKVGDEWVGTEVSVGRKWTGAKPEDLGEESVTVEGAAVPCKKSRVESGDATTAIRWTSEKYGLVKEETTAEPSSTTLLVKRSVKRKVGSTDVECREYTTTTKTADLPTIRRAWESVAVPGGLVRSETTFQGSNGIKVVGTFETVAFLKK